MRQRVEIRQPTIARVYIICFGLFWCGVLVDALLRRHSSADAAALLLMLGLGEGIVFLVLRLAVIADETGLVVRNNFGTEHLEWNEVEDFRVGGTTGGQFGKKIQVLLRNGDLIALDATLRLSISGRGRRELDSDLAALRAWL